MTGARSKINEHAPRKPGHGTSRRWQRTINGTPYSFTAVTMPGGERRYFVSKYNGYGDGSAVALSFGCAWSPVHSIIVNR